MTPGNALEAVRNRIHTVILQSTLPEEPIHAINTHEWLMKLYPDADEALQTAALGHDIERAFGDKRVHAGHFDTYDEYKQAHALNSAEILAGIMEECGVDGDTIEDVKHLVAHHETGGGEREELLKNADTLSFFHVSLPLYYDRKGADLARKRSVWGYRKLPDELKKIVADFDYVDETLGDIIRDALGINTERRGE